MALLQKVLTIIARILLGICVLAGVVCLVYTLSTAAVQAGFSSAKEAVAGMVDQAQAALEAGMTSAVAGVVPTSGAAGAPADASQGAPAQADGDASPTDGYADAYRQWEDAVSSPVERVFAQTGVSRSVLEGLAGGSMGALGVLTGLDDAALAEVSQAAANLGATASAHTVPATLPEDARGLLAQADAHCASFCEDVRKLVDAAGPLRAGNLLASSGVTSAAYAAYSELQGMDDCMAQARQLLGL